MASKFELSISFDYVPDWGVTEALRELFQNAWDNQTTNPNNKMLFDYSNNTVTIANKSSVLERSSLLMGEGTKHNDENTIGKHGEGYKLAFMVLLRNKKKVTVCNYSCREIWNARIVNSKKYGRPIPVVEVSKVDIWKKVPDNNLTITVEGITDDEWEQVKNKNLHVYERYNRLRYKNIEGFGRVLLDENMKGRMHVGGLFICELNEFNYGYDFLAKHVDLDRDRRLINSENLKAVTSKLWRQLYKDGIMTDNIIDMINKQSPDVYCFELSNQLPNNEYDVTVLESAGKELLTQLKNEHGENIIVCDYRDNLDKITRTGYKPVIVNSAVKQLIKLVDENTLDNIKIVPVKDRLKQWLEKVEDRLSDEELSEIQSIIEAI